MIIVFNMPSAESSNQKTKADDEKEFKLPSTTNSIWWIEGKLILWCCK